MLANVSGGAGAFRRALVGGVAALMAALGLSASASAKSGANIGYSEPSYTQSAPSNFDPAVDAGNNAEGQQDTDFLQDTLSKALQLRNQYRHLHENEEDIDEWEDETGDYENEEKEGEQDALSKALKLRHQHLHMHEDGEDIDEWEDETGDYENEKKEGLEDALSKALKLRHQHLHMHENEEDIDEWGDGDWN